MSSTTKVCCTCKLSKSSYEFKLSPRTGEYYERCQHCFLAANKLFWQDKKTKVCRQCQDRKSIDAYYRDRNDCPYSTCKSCHAEKVLLDHRKSRIAATVM